MTSKFLCDFLKNHVYCSNLLSELKLYMARLNSYKAFYFLQYQNYAKCVLLLYRPVRFRFGIN
jgi:hypothetical protein